MDPGPIGRRVIFTFVSLVVLGSVSLREYLRFPHGSSVASLVLPPDHSTIAAALVFVVTPIAASIALGIFISREIEKE